MILRTGSFFDNSVGSVKCSRREKGEFRRNIVIFFLPGICLMNYWIMFHI